ncbi:hypothetical protein Trydic_g3569 [Trypoxylus dichotomus]
MSNGYAAAISWLNRKKLSQLRNGQQSEKKYRFYVEQEEFSVQQRVLMRGHRAVVPKQLRNKVLSELHEGHFGIVKMKGFTRGFCWWPEIDTDIKNMYKLQLTKK